MRIRSRNTSFDGVPITVPGLLVTGRSGAGKTALLHAVSNAMEDDPRTLCCESHSYFRSTSRLTSALQLLFMST